MRVGEFERQRLYGRILPVEIVRNLSFLRGLMFKTINIATALLLAGLALAGCGVRGPLEAPPSAKAAQEAAATADSGQGQPAGATSKPHKPFILDGLIR